MDVIFLFVCPITHTGPTVQNDAKNGSIAPLSLQSRPVIKYDKDAAAISHLKIPELADLAVKFASDLTKEAIAKYLMPELVVEDTVYTLGSVSNHSHFDDGKSVYSVKSSATQKVSSCRHLLCHIIIRFSFSIFMFFGKLPEHSVSQYCS